MTWRDRKTFRALSRPEVTALVGQVVSDGSVPQPGQELAFATRDTSDTTTQLNDDAATLQANKITGLIAVVTGIGRPVEVEFRGLVGHSVAGGVVYAPILMNNARIALGPKLISKINAVDTHSVKAFPVLAAGVEYTFEVAKTLDVAGTGTYYADAAVNAVMSLRVVQR